jgi:hypothetical protein
MKRNGGKSKGQRCAGYDKQRTPDLAIPTVTTRPAFPDYYIRHPNLGFI